MELLLAEGKPEEVIEFADELPARLPWITNPAESWWRSSKAQALDRLGRTEEAIALLDEELELARAVGRAGGRRARAARPRHDRPRQRDRAPRGVGRAARAIDDAARATRRRCASSAPRSASIASRARPASRCTGRSSSRASAAPAALEERVRAELGATGARPRRDALSGVGSLTPVGEAGRRPRRGRAFQPRDRPGALRDAEDGRGPPLEHVPQARDPLAPAAPGRPRSRLDKRFGFPKLWGGV